MDKNIEYFGYKALLKFFIQSIFDWFNWWWSLDFGCDMWSYPNHKFPNLVFNFTSFWYQSQSFLFPSTNFQAFQKKINVTNFDRLFSRNPKEKKIPEVHNKTLFIIFVVFPCSSILWRRLPSPPTTPMPDQRHHRRSTITRFCLNSSPCQKLTRVSLPTRVYF